MISLRHFLILALVAPLLASDNSPPRLGEENDRQQSLLAHIQQLLIEYRRRQGVEELATRFVQLAQRQGGNLKATIDLTKLAAQRPRDQWEPALLDSQSVQQQEEQSLKLEIAQAVADLYTMTQASSPEVAKKLRPAADHAKSSGIPELAAAAAADLSAGNLFRAAGNE